MALTSQRLDSPAARAVHRVKTYGSGEVAVRALDGVNVNSNAVRSTAATGRYGSGKSTLMHCMAGLDVPSSGQTFVGDDEVGVLDDAASPSSAETGSGSCSSPSTWFPTLTAAENITIAADLGGERVDPEWFDLLVGQLRIADRLSHRPSELSGGQQQRVACARALIGRPELIFADEPTGNLDSNASADVLEFLRRAVSEHGQSIVMVTHDPRAAAYADRVVFLADGKLVSELDSPTSDAVLEQMKKLGD